MSLLSQLITLMWFLIQVYLLILKHPAILKSRALCKFPEVHNKLHFPPSRIHGSSHAMSKLPIYGSTKWHLKIQLIQTTKRTAAYAGTVVTSLPQIHNRTPKDARMINLQIQFSLRNLHLMKYSFLFNEIKVRGIIAFRQFGRTSSHNLFLKC